MDKMHYLLLCAALPIALIAQEKTPVAPVQGEITSVSDFFVKADRSTLSPDETIVKCLKLSENKSFRIIKRADGTLTKRFVEEDKPAYIDNMRNKEWRAPMLKTKGYSHFFENFEDYDGEKADWLPDGWQDVSAMEPPTVYDAADGKNYTWAVNKFKGLLDGNYGAVINKKMEQDSEGNYTGFGLKQDEWLISPAFTPDEGSSIYFQYGFKPSYTLFNMKAFMDSYNSGGTLVYSFDGEGNAILELHVSTDNGATWNKVWDCVADAKSYTEKELRADLESSSYVYKQPVVSIDEYIGKEIRIAFRYVGVDGESMVVDRVSTRPVISASYSRPAGALFNGFSKELAVLNTHYLLSAPYVTSCWKNISDSECEKFEWTFAGEKSQERDLYSNMEHGIYTVPELRASKTLADDAVYSCADASMVQFGGTYTYQGSNGPTSIGLGNCRLAKKFTSWGFGRDAYADWMWTILFGLANNETWVVGKVGNYFEKPDRPYYFTEMWVNCVTDCTDDAEFVMELFHVTDGNIDSEPFALGRCKGSDVLSFDISGGAGTSTYEIIPFKFYKIENGKEVELPYIVVDSPMMAFISGFDDPSKVLYYDTFTQYEPNDDGECNTYLLFDITEENGNKKTRLLPSSVITNGKPLYLSCCFNMDAVFPWLVSDDVLEYDAHSAGGSKDFNFKSYFNASALEVTADADWLKCTKSSEKRTVGDEQYGLYEYDVKLGIEVAQLPQGVASRECEVKVEGRAVSAVIKVTQGDAGVDAVSTTLVKVAVEGDNFVIDVPADDEVTLYNVAGMQIATVKLNAGTNVVEAGNIGKGMYILRFASDAVLKVVK